MYQQIAFEIEGLGISPSCPQAFPVNRFLQPGSDEARSMTVTSGQRLAELSTSYSPLGLLEKTLLVSSAWHSTMCLLTWQPKVTKRGHLLFQLLESAPRTGENEFSFWATPNTFDGLPQRSYEAMKRQATNGGRKNRRRPGNLREQVDPLMCKAYEEAREQANMGMWPTPTVHGNNNRKGSSAKAGNGLATVAKMWPTPKASAGGPGKNPNNPRGVHQGNPLATAVAMYPTPTTRDYKSPDINPESKRFSQKTELNSVIGGQLNPTWVEWLMGFPLGWTDLNA